MNILHERIKERLATLGLSQQSASMQASQKKNGKANHRMVSAILSGVSNSPTAETLASLAQVFDCDVAYLIGETASLRIGGPVRELPHNESVGIPIIGKVQANSFFQIDDFEGEVEQRVVSGPQHSKFPVAKHVAYEVSGDCMNALEPRPIFDGDTVLAVAWGDTGFDLMDGMVVVVEQSKFSGQARERTLKQVEGRTGGVALCPRSHNKSHAEIFLARSAQDDGVEVRVVGLVYKVLSDVKLGF
jgi:transcriptional regulator with XRE-family HTH domain